MRLVPTACRFDPSIPSLTVSRPVPVRASVWTVADASANPPDQIIVEPDSYLVRGDALRGTIQLRSDADALSSRARACQDALGITP